MPPSNQLTVDYLIEFADKEKLSVSVRKSIVGTIIVFTCSTIGFGIYGKMGLVIGGLIGSAIAAYNETGARCSLSDVIRTNMNDKQRQELIQSLEAVVRENSTNQRTLAMHYKSIIVRNTATYLKKEMKMVLLRDGQPVKAK